MGIDRDASSFQPATVARRLLAHPLAKGLDIDDPSLTRLRRRIVREKPFVKAIYDEWYGWIAASLPAGDRPVLELGSGPGFLAEHVPGLVTSDVFPCEGVQRIVDARAIPYGAGELRAIVMTDVLHHIPDAAAFFREASRTLMPGGAVLMVEPWNTWLARMIWRRLHHEPFEPGVAAWEFPSTGPLSGANTAIPWILFSRDRARFDRDFPDLDVRAVAPTMPFRYLISGGVSMRSLQPAWSFGLWRAIEGLLGPLMGSLAMFARIDVRRR